VRDNKRFFSSLSITTTLHYHYSVVYVILATCRSVNPSVCWEGNWASIQREQRLYQRHEPCN
jgi:hypothetical protein